MRSNTRLGPGATATWPSFGNYRINPATTFHRSVSVVRASRGCITVSTAWITTRMMISSFLSSLVGPWLYVGFEDTRAPYMGSDAALVSDEPG